MSQANVMTFLTEAGRDETLARAFIAAVENRRGEEAIGAVADFITTRGYAVSIADVESARARILDLLERDDSLSDAALSEVSGGIEPLTVGLVAAAVIPVAAMATLGAVGALIHNGSPAEKLKVFFSAW